MFSWLGNILSQSASQDSDAEDMSSAECVYCDETFTDNAAGRAECKEHINEHQEAFAEAGGSSGNAGGGNAAAGAATERGSSRKTSAGRRARSPAKGKRKRPGKPAAADGSAESSDSEHSSDSDVIIIMPRDKAARSTASPARKKGKPAQSQSKGGRASASASAASEAITVDDSENTDPVPSPDLATSDDAVDVDVIGAGDGGAGTIKVGDRVDARFEGARSRKYAGLVNAINADGTFDIKFDDGDRDLSVKPGDVYSKVDGKSAAHRNTDDEDTEADGEDDEEGHDEGASASLLSATSSGESEKGGTVQRTVTAAEMVSVMHEVTGQVEQFNSEEEAIVFLQNEGVLRNTSRVRKAAAPAVQAGVRAVFDDHKNSGKALKGWQLRIGDCSQPVSSMDLDDVAADAEGESSGGGAAAAVASGGGGGENGGGSSGDGATGSLQSQSTEATDPVLSLASELADEPAPRKPRKKRPKLAPGARLYCSLELTTHAGATIKTLLKLRARKHGCDCRLSTDETTWEDAHLAALYTNAPVLSKWLENASKEGGSAGVSERGSDAAAAEGSTASANVGSAAGAEAGAKPGSEHPQGTQPHVCSIEAGHVRIEHSPASVGPGLISIIIPGTTTAAITKFLFLCYTGHISIYIDEARDIFRVATALENGEVKDRCERLLAKLVNTSNCVELMRLADALNGLTLKAACLAHLRKGFKDLPISVFVPIPPRLFAEVLDSDELVVDTEMALLEVVEAWAAGQSSAGSEQATLGSNYTPEDCTTEEMVQILKTVRLTQIPIAELAEAAETAALPTIKAVPACAALIHDVLKFLDGEKSAAGTAELAMQLHMHTRDSKRSDWGAVRVFGQCDGTPRKAHVLEYDPIRNRWNQLSHVLCPEDETPVVVRVGDDTMAISISNSTASVNGSSGSGSGSNDDGDEDGDKPRAFGPTNRYDPEAKRWAGLTSAGVPLSNMNGLSRDGFGCAVYEGPAADTTLFAVGGATSASSEIGVTDVELFFLARNEWTTVQPLKFPRIDAAVCAYKDQMYVCGGYHRGALRSVERFNVANRRRGVAPNMITGRSAAAAVGVPDEGLYVIGGFGSGGVALSSVEWYSPTENHWATVKPMTVARGGASAVLLQGKLYVSGGMTARGAAGVKLTAVECYDLDTETWSSCAELPVVLRVFGGTAEGAV